MHTIMAKQSIYRYSLPFYFFYSLLFQLILPIAFPTLHVNWLAPFLILVFYRKEWLGALWISLFCGLIIDLSEPTLRFGFHALNYCVATFFIYKYKQNFFCEKLFTLPLLSFVFSLLVSCSALIFSSLMENVSLSIKNFLLQTVSLASATALYSLIAFNFSFFLKRKRKQQYYFHSHRKKRI